jgi:ketosteroid isomerase-like protein
LYYPRRMNDRDFDAVKSAVQLAPIAAAGQQEVLLAVITAIGANDIESLYQYFTDDAELHIHGFPAMDGSWRGRKEVVAAVAVNFGKITEQKPEIEAMIHQGESIAMLIHETGRLKPDGRGYEVRGVIWYTFQGAQLRRVEEFVWPKSTTLVVSGHSEIP